MTRWSSNLPESTGWYWASDNGGEPYFAYVVEDGAWSMGEAYMSIKFIKSHNVKFNHEKLVSPIPPEKE